jgi:Putative MetA-pathway of phenol degradation
MRSFLVPIALAAAAQAHAAHPLVTEDAGTQGAGGWQLEANAEWIRDQATRAVLPAATLAYGVAESVDLQFTAAYLDVRDGPAGGLDSALEAKWRFRKEGPLGFALMPGLLLPTGDEAKGLGTGSTGWSMLAIASYEPAGTWAMHAHAGYTENRNRIGERVSLWQVAGAVLWRANASLTLALDLSAQTNPGGGRTLQRVVLGALYAVSDDLDLDVGVREGNEPALDRALLVGVTLRW